ncbi:MAG: ribonuclease Z, partial [Deltaproteobacteria bacterium]|nr:ribonuclease Z [Deltaproteobacteria bacterium]
MDVVILGSGTGIPLRDRASPSLLLMTPTAPVLFDIGPGALRQLTRLGISWNRVGEILLTHFHPDHTADLVPFLFATRNPSALRARKPFGLTGPAGFRDFLSGLQGVYEGWLTLPPDVMKITELSTREPEKRVRPDFTLH